MITPSTQEVERKAWTQFKGLFDKKPGEIADVAAADPEESHISDKDPVHKNHDDTNEEELDDLDGTAAAPPRTGFLSRIWPSGKRFFSTLGLNGCNIL